MHYGLSQDAESFPVQKHPHTVNKTSPPWNNPSPIMGHHCCVAVILTTSAIHTRHTLLYDTEHTHTSAYHFRPLTAVSIPDPARRRPAFSLAGSIGHLMEPSCCFLLWQSICHATGSLSLFMKLLSRQTEANKKRYNMFASTPESVLSLLIFLRLVLVNDDSRLPRGLGVSQTRAALCQIQLFFLKVETSGS